MKSNFSTFMIIAITIFIASEALLSLRESRELARKGTPLPTATASPTPSVYYLIDEIVPPQELTIVDPVYPREAYDKKVEALVIMSVIITKEGDVTSIDVLTSGGPQLDTAAIETVKQWKYTPATLKGVPVPVYYNISIQFSVSGKEIPKPFLMAK